MGRFEIKKVFSVLPEETKMMSMIGRRIFQWVGVFKKPAAHTQQKLTRVPAPPPARTGSFSQLAERGCIPHNAQSACKKD